MTFRVLSWNILQGGGKRIEGICSAIEELQPDFVALQEYRENSAALQLNQTLKSIGLSHQHKISAPAKTNTVMVASRYPCTTVAWSDSLPVTQAVCASVELPDSSGIDILAAHFPHKKKQIPFFSALLDKEIKYAKHALLVGDLNCGIPFEDSETKTFDNTHLFQALLSEGWTDSWRSRNTAKREYTWISPKGNGYRYDHCLSTQALDVRIKDVRYLHELREQRLSDHAPMLVDIE